MAAARHELSDRLKHLVSSGQLIQVDSDRYAIPRPPRARTF